MNMYIYIYTRTCIHPYISESIRKYIHVQSDSAQRPYVDIHVLVCIIYMYHLHVSFTCMYKHAHISRCRYINICIYTPVYIYIYIPLPPSLPLSLPPYHPPGPSCSLPCPLYP